MAPRRCSRVLWGGQGGQAWLWGYAPRSPRRKQSLQRQAPMRGQRGWRGKSRGWARVRTSGAAGHAAVAAMGLPSPPPSPRPRGQGRWQRLITRRAAAEVLPDSKPDPRMPSPTRTLKHSSRRHAPPARRPSAPLSSGLLNTHAQCCRSSRLRAQGACARVRCGSAGIPAQAQTQTASRPLPLPHP